MKISQQLSINQSIKIKHKNIRAVSSDKPFC